MKKYILITLLSLFSVALFAQTIKEKADQNSYKHESNTIFAIKDGNDYHAFKCDDKTTYLGYITFDGTPQPVEPTRTLEIENDKHISDSYYFLVEDNTYYLHYKNYMGNSDLLTSVEYLTANGVVEQPEEIVVKIEGEVVETEEVEKGTKEAVSEAVTAVATKITEELKESEDEDESGGLAWYWWVVIFWLLFGGFSGSKS